ncbi:MAG: nitrous oxide reductase family maturation protein NosD [Gammaproteobacteria bacterium]|nr:nitrous oxide reductase family maturation protein NosD [Gammaproteobacteria bacterium]
MPKTFFKSLLSPLWRKLRAVISANGPIFSSAVIALMLLPPLSSYAAGLPSLQALVDAAEPNATIVPPPGTYAGPVIIDSPLTIDGQGKVTVDAGGKGSVIYIDTDGAVIKNMHLTNSGESHNDIDSGVQVRGKFNVIKDNIIDNTLFGIDLQQSDFNIIRRNTISSKDTDLGMRGDSVRLWYSFNNKITHNTIRNSRDMVVWYSADNTISHNDSRGGRYSLHFMYSRYNLIESNHYEHNSVGIFLMYSDSVVIKNNYIAYANGATGMGIGFKESSDIEIEGNQILYCATGMYIDISPYQPDTTNRIKNNVIAFTSIGIDFLNDWKGNIFEGNSFKANQTQISVSGGKTANRNSWYGNYWDDYEGFDQDHDGVGDTNYELFGYADRLWMDVPAARFLKGTPIMAVLDFLERLAPFSTPDMLVRDKHPLMTAKVNLSKPENVEK